MSRKVSRIKSIMGFLGSILLKYYGRRDLSSQGRKGLFWRAFVQASKTNAIFGLGFFTHADLYSNSDEAEETKKLMAGMDSLSESLEKLMARIQRKDGVFTSSATSVVFAFSLKDFSHVSVYV
ncbi:PREDICTED: uncharacterized protein LOC104767048 [Camelina sativa]|uniref:Uncharacterized protein LOC104767048 n=1 Tax=Camelina sativa TaxID=90675 RepID=A0ABM0XQG2_CAMSA|nr:PREDICTED: uncharacterized protein LOC104767048 [Camelina sativa]